MTLGKLLRDCEWRRYCLRPVTRKDILYSTTKFGNKQPLGLKQRRPAWLAVGHANEKTCPAALASSWGWRGTSMGSNGKPHGTQPRPTAKAVSFHSNSTRTPGPAKRPVGRMHRWLTRSFFWKSTVRSVFQVSVHRAIELHGESGLCRPRCGGQETPTMWRPRAASETQGSKRELKRPPALRKGSRQAAS